jgi:hypothetical protein
MIHTRCVSIEYILHSMHSIQSKLLKFIYANKFRLHISRHQAFSFKTFSKIFNSSHLFVVKIFAESS